MTSQSFPAYRHVLPLAAPVLLPSGEQRQTQRLRPGNYHRNRTLTILTLHGGDVAAVAASNGYSLRCDLLMRPFGHA